ncbi:MAG: restriction endonuclease subunit S [Methylococcales bacterium]|nr:restriction endonuclease subunit S [Methylococcales bacterium]
MITSDTFKSLLLFLDFTQNSNVYSKTFANGAVLTADFVNEKLIFPEGVIVHDTTTSNFSVAENFVVFECVHRLLEKGYATQSIELEPRWQVGRGAAGGKADILVKDKQGDSLLIIECKTAGKEFNKAWQNTLEDGGQLFGYAANEAPEFLCLYASDFVNESVKHNYYLISLKDSDDFLAKNSNTESARFSNARTREQLFEVWKNSYDQDAMTKGIFEHSVQAYILGKQKVYLEDLQTLSGEDIQPKYHEFATIMRQHNISGRENAFDKLVNLFLCKILDEFNNENVEIEKQDLKFYWGGYAQDSYFNLIDRLQELYQKGMDKFLDEPVTYVDNAAVDNAFRYFQNKPDATRDTVKELFKQLKYFTNSDFAFIDVHNETLFYQNATVLLKIVKMLQDIKLLQKDSNNQFLGDLFEGFLDNGVKQSEGQFFTPMPICRFIMQSLPLKTLFTNSEEPPKVIDYACGAGHFLNELAMQITPFVQDKAAHYSQFYGIEKEYRLSKVAKVSAFMYGQNEINIIYGDALASHAKIENDSFSLLVANPPYSVKGFLATLDKKERAKYELFRTINDKSIESNNSIETFFIERAKQLLKVGGIAAIIVPSSILSNSDGTYTATRSLLLAYFDIVSIVEFGSGTFGKTGTNTVTLFLRRKKKMPEVAHHYACRVKCWFDFQDLENDRYEDAHLIHKYCAHIGIPFEQYETLLNGKPSAELLAHEMFINYRKDFDYSSDITKLKTQKFFKDFTQEQKQTELNKRFRAYLTQIEKEKLLYFVLAYDNPQPVLIIKNPSDTKKQKAFLGYEWSGRKGDEGIKLTTDSNGKHFTPLYDETNRDNPEKINTLITQNFLGELAEIPEFLQPFASLVNLVDMLDFSQERFYKKIWLKPKKATVEIETRWDLFKLGEVCDVLIGGTPSRKIQDYFTGHNLWVSISEMNGQIIHDTKEKITDEGVQKSNVKLIPTGTTLLSFKLSIGKTAIAGKDLYTNEAIAGLIPKDKEKLLDSYIYQLFNAKQIDLENTGFKAFGKSLNSQFLREDVKIPLPPLDIQQQIVSECEAIDLEVEKAELTLKNAKIKIRDLFTSRNFVTKRLAETTLKVSDNVNPQEQDGDVDYIGLENIESETGRLVGEIKTAYSTIKSTKTCFKKYDVLYGKLRPNLNKVYLAERDGICSTDILVFRFESQEIAKFYAYYFLSKQFNDEVLQGVSGQQLPRTSWSYMQMIKIPVPDLETQQKVVSEIEMFEKQIDDAQKVIDGAASRKAAVLRKFL